MSTSIRTALIVVDMQSDFMPGGALAVAEGDALIEPIRDLVLSGRFDVVVATQDWHPPQHISFASRHEGRNPFDVIELYGHEQVLWPDHCVQGTPGAALHPGVPRDWLDAIMRKGNDPAVDSYSGFRNNWNRWGDRPPTGLGGYLRERGITHLLVCGLARDYCVKWTAEDAVEAGFKAQVLWELTRSVDPGGDERVLRDLKASGVEVQGAG
jgi:nicotinamidase/pyrazinamidase